MHYALAPRTFLFSHYFSTGLRIATGIVGLTFLTYALADLPTAIAVAMGALCTSLMDMPSPLRHKFNEMLAGVLLCSVVALLVSLSSQVEWLLFTVIVLVSFLSSMMVVYGRKAMPLQFAALFVMMLSSEAPSTPLQALRHGALFFAGGAGYMAYAMAVVWILQRRLKQQVLAEALYELAVYTNIKAGCYDVANSLPAQMEKLVREQSVLAERQQASRDLVLRGKPTAGEAVLVQVHYAMIDLYELVLSTHTDYVLLRQHFTAGPILPLLGDLIGKAARDIEAVAYAMTRDQPSRPAVDYRDELRTLEAMLRQLPAGDGDDFDAQATLRATANKIGEVIAMIGRLHAASHASQADRADGDALPMVPHADMTPFLTQQRYSFDMLVANLRWSSPVFRFALRVAMAITVGLVASQWLPYTSHGYWTALTIAVILKPSFSMTRQRRADRLVGTLVGCMITAVILHFVQSPAALIGFLFVATAAAPTFLSIKYRYTAVAASVQALLLIGLTVPHGASVIGERLFDTLLGTLIATVFSRVLPNWEYQNLPRLVDAVLDANRRYIDAAADLLLKRTADDGQYRISRKRFMDSLATLSAALGRMLDEPAGKRRAPDELNRFTVQNYLLVAHMAALRLLLQRYRENLPVREVEAALEGMFAEVRASLGAPAESGPAAPEAQTTWIAEWPGWAPLQRRLRLLRQDAAQVAQGREAIGAVLDQK
ncbi:MULTISPECIES: FUSC family membrane protein [unclassified Massilia]|uniref:FUSC family protein n=1 Tax=unclassified Massilia TaxID=2609279 RepID=UPI0017809249|nr:MULTISPECIES: FUSC family membrane protein [unclassified Massilia]MBD8531028.1 FUSC family protein [Massilia sp. CFBP 13647]MBD8674728.1 FUSC family protein [Massilia sp. CFBP 13721]